MLNEKYTSLDCVIIGGGPAGATAATVLADHGRKTLVLEQSQFPRYHIGESLMPQTFHTFSRIGMLDKLRASDFPRKESVQFVNAFGKQSKPFYFTDRDPNDWSITWQVPRDRFDKMMLDNAREHGAEVIEGARVTEVMFDGAKAIGIKALVDGEETAIPSRVVIDASGHGTLLARQLGLYQLDPDLRNAAIYSYYQGAKHDEGRNAGATIIIHTPDRNGWFWFIPLPNDVASIGVVAPPEYLFTGRGNDPLATLEEEIAKCPNMATRIADAQRVSPCRVTKDFSYRSRQMAGDGWILIGDAFGFLDPIYSSGIMLALKGGEFAADAIHEALKTGNPSADRLSEFAPKFLSGMHMIRQLLYAFYNPDFSFAEFTKSYPQFNDAIVRVLIGDVFNDDLHELFSHMSRRIPLPAPIQLEEV